VDLGACDEAGGRSPGREVRERLTALASDVDVLVAERAQAALAR